MTTKEVKRWLSGTYWLTMEVERLRFSRERAFQQATGTTAATDGVCVQSSGDSTARFQSLLELDEQIEKAIRKLNRAKAKRLEVIQQVPDSRVRVLLTMRYVDGATFERIAVETHYSWRQVHRLHGRALEMVRDVLDNKMS